MIYKMKKNICYHTLFVILTLVAATMYVFLMFNNNVWYDEAYSLAMIKHSFGEIVSITAADVHPPLYYFGLKLFCMIFGNSLICAKIFSIIPLILTMVTGYFNLSKIFDYKTALIFVGALVFMPLYQGYAVEVRMYTWASFTVFGCGIYSYRAIVEDKRLYWILSTLFGILSAYLHYFAFVSVLVIGFMLLLASVYKYKVSKWAISFGALIVSYLPWMSSFLSQLSQKVTDEYWIAPITGQTIKNFFSVWLQCGNITPFYIIFFTTMLVLSIVMIITKLKFKRLFITIMGLLVFVVTCAIGIGASLAVRPVFIERYAVPAIPLVLIIFAVGLGTIKSKTILAVICAFAVFFSAMSYPKIMEDEYEASEKYIEACLGEREYDAIICCVDSHLFGVLSYYENEKNIYRPKLSPGSPFENVVELDTADATKDKTVLMFLDHYEDPPQWVYNNYNIEYTCDVATYGKYSHMYTCNSIN